MAGFRWELGCDKIKVMSKNQEINSVPVIIIGLIILAISLLFASQGGGIEYQIDDAAFSINSKGWKGMTVSYADIEIIEIRDDIDPGRRTGGFGSSKFKLGNFRNGAFGDYTLYAFTSCQKLIVMNMKDNSIIAINAEDDTATKALFETLQNKLK